MESTELLDFVWEVQPQVNQALSSYLMFIYMALDKYVILHTFFYKNQ